VLIGIVVWTCLAENIFSQTGCKVENTSEPVKGEFSINGNKVNVKGDGGRSLTATNNIPIKICEGEVITLKNTLPVTSSTSNTYWIIEEGPHWSNTAAIQSLLPVGSYSNINNDFSVKLIEKSNDANGFSLYNGPGRYVVIQYDNSAAIAGGGGIHYACQVIEVIAPKAPVATVNTCTDSEFQIVIPTNANNIFDDYEVTFTPVAGIGDVIKNTGKQTLPYTLKALMPDNRNRIINIKGVSATGGCVLAPSLNLGQKTVNATSLFKPNIISIAGTTIKAEFDIKLGAQIGTTWNFYIRDITDPLNYNNYTNHFLQQGSTSTGVTELVRITVPNADKQYCFQASAVDLVCGTNEISNQEICTTPAKVIPENDKNVISWLRANGGAPAGVSPTPFINYEVDLMRVDGTVDQTLFASNSITDLSFEHQPVTCGNDYIYRVRTNYGSLSYSQIIKVQAISNKIPSKIPKFLATMTGDNKNVYLQGDFNLVNKPTDIKPNNYKYYRANSLTEAFSLIKTDNSIYQDLTADANKQQYCYYMTWTNLCNKESEPSEKVCTTFLRSSGSSVSWTKEKPHSVNTDSYIVQKVDPLTGNNIKELVSNLQGVYTYNTIPLPETEGQEIYVQIETRPVGWSTSDPDRLPNTLSNVIKIFRPSLVMSPQIFTPNGDNNNDKFMIRGKFIKSMKMTIYDRWGNAIFYDEQSSFPLESNQNESTVVGWNGVMSNGNKAMEGSYAFKIEVEDTIGQISTKEGALLLAY
jgi:gliding motility-associated-like protein